MPAPNDQQIKEYREMARELRRDVLNLVYKAKAPHIGSSFSIIEILVALYYRCLMVSPGNVGDNNRDIFILSKGHACPALYCALARRGFISPSELAGFGINGGTLEFHPTRNNKMGIEVSTGSLGHGLSIGAGMALAAKHDKTRRRVFVLLGDGELNEGSIWEAAMFSAHHNLDNLVAIIDYNKIQATGRTHDVLNLEPLAAKWHSFGWAVVEVGGHDIKQLISSLQRVPFQKGKPGVIVAHTVKGKGVSFMENELLWHYRCPDRAEYARALRSFPEVRDTAIRILEKLCAGNADIFLLSADLGFKLFDNFKNAYPDRFINTGVAEANMIGVAAGLALSGKNAYCYSMVPFLTMRCFEQVRVDLCYHNLNVKLLGVGGGLHYGFEGMTHHAIEDIAIMRSLPNMTVVVPGDPEEVRAVMQQSVTHGGPLYIRLAKDENQLVYDTNPAIKIGKGSIIHKGSDISIFANGSMLYPAKLVMDKLAGLGLSATLVSMHTVKPLDRELIRRCAMDSRAVFTIEEHSIIGGLGSAVGEALMELNYKGLFRRIGIPDEYSQAIGSNKYLCESCGITSEAITDYVLREYQQRQC